MGNIPYYMIAYEQDGKIFYLSYQDDSGYYYLSGYEMSAEKFMNIESALNGWGLYIDRIAQNSSIDRGLTNIQVHRKIDTKLFTGYDY